MSDFPRLNRGYNAVFRPERLSIGLVVPLESYSTGPAPTMQDHLERARLAEELGFAALWLRDVPFNVPSFGDAGQLFDPFVYLGLLAGATRHIALGTASIVLPLRHPAQVAKAAASADVLSDGRLILGVASGDRPEEYPAMAQRFADRGERFRDAWDYIRAMAGDRPQLDNRYGQPGPGMDMLPKPASGKLPMMVTGGSQQSPEWIAEHGDGWMLYPRPHALQSRIIADYRAATAAAGRGPRPVMQPLYVDLCEDPDASPIPIHLGLRTGINPLRVFLSSLSAIGVEHVALNLRFNRADIPSTLRVLAEQLLPHFH